LVFVFGGGNNERRNERGPPGELAI